MEQQITINQNENQSILINSNNSQIIDINNLSSQDININATETQNLNISQPDNQLIYIDENGAVIGITNVLVNGVSVVSGNIAYVLVPTKTSELINDSGYITNEIDPTVPSIVKSITLSDINNWNNKQNELVSGSNIKTINNTSLLGSGNINIEGTIYTAGSGININENNIISNTITSYNDLTDLPSIPTKTSELINDSDFVHENDLAEVALTGSYASLSDTPIIPDSTSQLTNDSGYVTGSEVSTEVQTAISTKQDTLVSGTNIKTINNNSILGSGNLSISGGGGSTDVQINGTSIVSNDVANIITESAYNSSTNKIATKSDIPTQTSQLTNNSNYISYDSNGNVNIPVSTNTLQSNGNTYLRYNSSDSVILSSNASALYLRPNGSTNTLGQTVLLTNGNLELDGKINHVNSIEIYNSTPYIDFHFNNSSSDYTSRIIENTSGHLTQLSTNDKYLISYFDNNSWNFNTDADQFSFNKIINSNIGITTSGSINSTGNIIGNNTLLRDTENYVDNNTDFNNLTKTGCTLIAGKTGMSNAPLSGTLDGVLMTMGLNTYDMYVQIFFDNTTNKVLMRWYWYSVFWSPWIQLSN